MPLEMQSCPHCGTKNSAKKRICHHCQQEMAPQAQSGVTQRQLRPRQVAVPPVVPQRPLAPPQQSVAPQQAAAPQQTITRQQASVTVPPAPAQSPRGPSLLFTVSLRQRAQFYRQMHSLMRSGIPLGLGLTYQEASLPAFMRPMLRELAEHVQQGGKLSEAMLRYPAVFPEWETSMVKAGETGGSLPESFRDIAESIEMEWDLRSRVNVSTFHLKATLVVFVLVALVVAAVQSGTGGLSGVLVSLQHAALQFILFIAAVIGLIQFWKGWVRTRTGARFASALVARTPMIGPILKHTTCLRFARVLGALWNAGVPPIEALETAARASGSPHIIHQVNQEMAKLSQGGTLSEVLSPTGIFPPQAMYLVQSGETSGTIGQSLHQVAEYLQMELEAQVKTLPARLQLVVYAVLVPLVLLFMISFYTRHFAQLLNGF